MDKNIFEKFTDKLKKVLVLSESLAKEQGLEMNTEHLLLASVLVKDTLSSEILNSFSITPDRIRLVMALITKNSNATKAKAISTTAKSAIQSAVSIASRFGHYTVDCEHLLLALMQNKNFNSYLVMERMGVQPKEITTQIESIFQNIKQDFGREDQGDFGGNPPEDGFEIEMPPMGNPFGGGTMQKTKKESLLESFTVNLTKEASNGQLDAVIGREEEITRMIQVLCRRTKNNPILVGEPGVGKTAIVEGLAQRITHGRVPVQLLGKELLSLDMGSLIAGTMYRGQFEGRVKKIINEIKKKNNVILFIDEIHTVVGAGSTEGSVDAANLLKPALARGDFRLIGSTTIDEYKKHIEKDPAFERRLQPVKIEEPSVADTILILKGIKDKYEIHHNIIYTEEAIEAAAKFAKRYINDRFLPDKAIDLIDEAAAAANISISKSSIKLMRLKKQLREILKRKDDLILSERYKDATMLRKKEMAIEKEISEIKGVEQTQEKQIIDEEDIARVVSRWTGVPVSNLTVKEKKRFVNLEGKIKQAIIGQDHAITEIVKAIKRARVGISNPNRPMGSFIFLGPTGVGKTELVKVLSRELLGSEKNLVKIDMSEFMEKHNVSRLVGAPAGYIGYEEGGKLTEIVRKNPYSIILLDEIEKAHPEVFNILLQVMEDGELTDAKGRKIDFKNTIIIMTSNLGTDLLNKQASIGFNKKQINNEDFVRLEENVKESVDKHFKPEFLNRLDKIIVFRPLNEASIKRVAALEYHKLQKRLEEKGYILESSKEIIDWIAEKGYDPKFGARPLRKVLTENFESEISDLILSEKISANTRLIPKIEKDQVKIEIAGSNL